MAETKPPPFNQKHVRSSNSNLRFDPFQINALVKDEHFQREIDEGKKFAKGDILVIRLRTRPVTSDGSIKNEHEILEVVEHIPGEAQTELPLLADQPNSTSGDSNSPTVQT
jgi:hypothetical protein